MGASEAHKAAMRIQYKILTKDGLCKLSYCDMLEIEKIIQTVIEEATAKKERELSIARKANG